jgi:hypothetical protein
MTVVLGFPAAHAQEKTTKVVANQKGIYAVDARGQRTLIAKPKSDELFAATTLSVSPDRAWALIDHVPRNAGPGRIEEVRVLISLRNGTRIEPEGFKKRYGEWLGELADWAADAPSTIELESGQRIPLR